ncbi:MAG: penicillin acylase family protein [Alphaproteobacteria bacterium]|nr:penicillin acylase family protein [Alphaproteobacteria bacterium]
MTSRLARRAAIGAVLVVLGLNVLAALGLLWLRGSLPTLDGEVPGLAALTAPVTIDRDARGVVWIDAATTVDAAYALGWVHAQDRLWQMEMIRRIGAGRLSEVVGEKALGIDRFMRTLGLYRLAAGNYARLPVAARAEIDAYAAGVNAQLERRSGPLPPEFVLLGHAPEPWRPADSLVWGRLMALQLSGNWAAEATRARLLAAGLTAADLETLYARLDTDDPPLITADRAATPSITTERWSALLTAVPPVVAPRLASNAWVVSGSRTATGKPILAGDPHLGFSFPSLWHLARVKTPDSLRVGAFVPGVPFLVLGHNGHLAWSLTTTTSDTHDLFVETVDPTSPERYLTPEGARPFMTRREIIGVGDDETVAHQVRWTRHGPVLSDVSDDAKAAATEGTVLALASPILAEDDGTAEALWRMARATGADAFLDALRLFHAPHQNVFFADSTGRFGMISAGRVPIRRAGDGWLPADGASGRRDWVGWADFEALPGVVDPKAGTLLNANNRVIGRDPSLWLGREFDAPYRAEVITDQLAEFGSDITVDDMRALQRDSRSRFAKTLVPRLLAAVEGAALADPVEIAAVAKLRAWDHRMIKEDAAPLIFAAWARHLHRVILVDEPGNPADAIHRVRPGPLFRILDTDSRWCDDRGTNGVETCPTAIRQALADATRELARRYGTNVSAWRWGDAHQATFAHRVLGQLPLIGEWLTPTAATDGGDFTVSRGSFRGPANDPYRHIHGAGFSAVYDLASLDDSRFSAALGASGNPLSPLATIWHEDWAAGRDHVIGPTPTVRAHRLTLTP